YTKNWTVECSIADIRPSILYSGFVGYINEKYGIYITPSSLKFDPIIFFSMGQILPQNAGDACFPILIFLLSIFIEPIRSQFSVAGQQFSPFQQSPVNNFPNFQQQSSAFGGGTGQSINPSPISFLTGGLSNPPGLNAQSGFPPLMTGRGLKDIDWSITDRRDDEGL
uniref:Uncharacterized protein n=1 Tax=Romanomermis culicivorax TaxID=13658 RepID=A0A915HJ59_ROMCU